VAVVRVSADGRYLEADAGALEAFDMTVAELRDRAIGDFAGPHAHVARAVWRHFAAKNASVPTGEATIHRLDGSTVRVRYTAVESESTDVFRLDFDVLGSADGPPVADRLEVVLDAWREAEREQEPDSDVVDGLRTLHRHGLDRRLESDARRDK